MGTNHEVQWGGPDSPLQAPRAPAPTSERFNPTMDTKRVPGPDEEMDANGNIVKRNAYAMPPVNRGLTNLSTQTIERFNPSERKALDVAITASGVAKDDYYDQTKRLSATGMPESMKYGRPNVARY